jgi:hypothetical protein
VIPPARTGTPPAQPGAPRGPIPSPAGHRALGSAPAHAGWLLAVVAVTGVLSLGMSWFVAQHSEAGARWGFIALIGVWVPLWLAGAWAARRLPVRTSVVVILVLAALLRLAAATGTTTSISSDVFRYSWDAHVQLSGMDPYRYPPDAPRLRALRTPGYWPSAVECHHLRTRTGCSNINRTGDRTIYPAVAEGWFVVVHLLNPGDAGGRPWQIAAGLIDDAVIVALLLALRDRRKDPRAVAWYALSPLPVIEFAGNGHVDGLALLFMVLALVALRRGRRGWAGVLVGLAIMVKLYPGLALAAGWRRGRWRFVVAAAVVCVLTEAPHVLAVGARVLGYIPGYLKEEKYTSGGRFLLLGMLDLPGRPTTVLAVALVVAAAVYVWRSGLDPETGLTIALAVLMFVTTPAQPWYAVAVAGVAVLAGRPWLLVVPLAAEPYYAAAVFNVAHQVAIGRACYGGAGLIVLAASWHHHRRDRAITPDRPALIGPSPRGAGDGVAHGSAGHRRWPSR